MSPSEKAYEMFSVKDIKFDGKINIVKVENRSTKQSELFEIYIPGVLDKAGSLGSIASHMLHIHRLISEEPLYIASSSNKSDDGIRSLFGFISGTASYFKARRIGIGENVATQLLLNKQVAEAMEKCRQLFQQQQ